MQRAGAREAYSGGSLDGEECSALDGDVQIISGALEASLPQVEISAAEHAEIVHGAIQRAEVCAGDAGGQSAIEGALAFEADGAGVGDIVGQEVERLGLGGEPGERRVETTIHRV